MPSTLPPVERGLVAGLACLGAEKAVLDRILATAEARAAWAILLHDLPREQRVTALADLLQDTATPLPPGIETLHPSWVADALANEAGGLAAALGSGQTSEVPWPLDADDRRALGRLVFASLEALTVAPAGPLGEQLAALQEQELIFEVTRWGARTVGDSLAGAPLELRARAMASAGAPWASEIAGAAARHLEPASRESARVLVARASRLPAPTPLHRLRALGLLALAGALSAEGGASVQRVAGRLPIELGQALLALA